MYLSRAVPVMLAAVAVQVSCPTASAGPYRPAGFETTETYTTARLAPLGAAPDPAAGAKAKYANLLKKIDVPEDRETYGDYYDWGHWSGSAWRGHTGLPAGYWVYVDGVWYIFGTHQEQPEPGTSRRLPSPVEPASHGKRPWGPEQATGAPDTPQAGDHSTAWASRTADGQAEWLAVTYDQPVDAVAIIIHETYNPGAIHKVTAFDAEGNEHPILEDADSLDGGRIKVRTTPPRDRNVAVIPVNLGFPTRQVKIYLDSPAVAGWNEIDAVGLLDAQGQTHWASGAAASSTYADRVSGIQVDGVQEVVPEKNTLSAEDRIGRLDAEVKALRAEIAELKAALERHGPRGVPVWQQPGLQPAIQVQPGFQPIEELFAPAIVPPESDPRAPAPE